MKSLKYDLTVLIGILFTAYGLHLIHDSLAYIFLGCIMMAAGSNLYHAQRKVNK